MLSKKINIIVLVVLGFWANSCENPIESLNLDKDNVFHKMESIKVEGITHSTGFVFLEEDIEDTDMWLRFVYADHPNPTNLDHLAYFLINYNPGLFPLSKTRVGAMRALVGSKTHYVRAMSFVGNERVYGKVISFETLPAVEPTIVLQEDPYSTHNSVSCVLFLNDNGGQDVHELGIVLGESSQPTILDRKVSRIYKPSFGRLELEAVGLSPATEYYIRPFLQTTTDVFYGEEQRFETTNGSPIINEIYFGPIFTESMKGHADIFDYGLSRDIVRLGFEYGESVETMNQVSEVPVNTLYNDGFAGVIEGLNRSSVYYIRAFAENSFGKGYSEIREVFTREGIPDVITEAVVDTTTTTARIRSLVMDDGGVPYEETGIAWAIHSNPSKEDTFIATSEPLKEFELEILGLGAGGRYYVRAYAVNKFGAHYGNLLQFNTPTE